MSVQYLKSCLSQAICLSSSSNLPLATYSDAHCFNYPLTCHSLTGYFIFLGDYPISWKTKKKPTVSLSSAEAEYQSIVVTCCQHKCLRQLLVYLQISHSFLVKLQNDTQVALVSLSILYITSGLSLLRLIALKKKKSYLEEVILQKF